jgi:hypothetical protein
MLDDNTAGAAKAASEERRAANEHQVREETLDKTIADSFPTSDPPSTIPDPGSEESLARSEAENRRRLFAGLAAGSWVALSVDKKQILATGKTRDEAEQGARTQGHDNMTLIEAQPEWCECSRASDEAA